MTKTKNVLTDTKVMCFVASAKPDEAKTFYSETLGLTFLEDNGFSLVFAVGSSQTLRIQKVPEFVPQSYTVFGWEVEDIEATVTSLSERGVTFEFVGFPGQDERGIFHFPNGDQVAWFKDPDGNTLSIAQL